MEKEQILKAMANCQIVNGCEAYTIILEQDKRIEEIKSDTVRKMQKAIKERCIKGGIYPVFVKNVVEAVAKELLEDVTPPRKAPEP